MSRLVGWIKDVSDRLFDPKREQRLEHLAAALEQALARDRRDFNLEQTLLRLAVLPEDRSDAIERTYLRYVQRAWADADITANERKALDWVAKALSLAPDRAKSLEQAVGSRAFERAFGTAISDGQLDPREIDTLARIAAHIGTDLRGLMTGAFRQQGEALIRNIFTGVSRDGEISDAEWSAVVRTVSALGITESELRQIIAPQARRFLEHLLVEVKADGHLTADERRLVESLLLRFKLDLAFTQYVRETLDRLQLLTNIKQGRLPSLPISDVGLRAGEIVHFDGPCTFTHVRRLSNGPREDTHAGRLLITDDRLLFTSATRSCEVTHRRVIEILQHQRRIELRTSGKGAGLYDLGRDWELGWLIYRSAVRKVNQTLVQPPDNAPSRHIPRDVRQRVWQKYAGRCAECASDQYLEFDHIVPIARGGSNSEANVQLLCRACNLAKSDTI